MNRGPGGSDFVQFRGIAAWREIEIIHGIVSTVLSGVVGIRGGKDQRNEEKTIS